jgi:hypothetical protein
LLNFLRQENVGGTTYYYSAGAGGSSSPASGLNPDAAPVVMPNYHMYPGTPTHLTKAQPVSSPSRNSGAAAQPQQQQQPPPPMASTSHTTHLTNSLGTYYLLDEFRLELLNRNALVLATPNTHANPGTQFFLLYLG